MRKTPSEAANYILDIYLTHLQLRPGEVLRVNNFVPFFARDGWRSSDMADGLKYAIDQSWIEEAGSYSFRLTETGHSEGQMDISRRCNHRVTVKKQDGTRHEGVKSLVTGDTIFVPGTEIAIVPGDVIENKLPNGHTDRLQVLDANFYGNELGVEPHYQIKYRREGVQPAGGTTNVFQTYGDNARNYAQSQDFSQNIISNGSDLKALAHELGKLREALGDRAESPEEYAALGAVSAAEKAAKGNDAIKAEGNLSKLGAAGKWVLDVAKDIGTDIATEVIKKTIGVS